MIIVVLGKERTMAMGSYYVTYKCPLCGTIIRCGNPADVPQDKLPEILGMVVRNQMMQGNPALHQAPMYIPHKCKDGNAGLAVFAGFTQERKKQSGR